MLDHLCISAPEDPIGHNQRRELTRVESDKPLLVGNLYCYQEIEKVERSRRLKIRKEINYHNGIHAMQALRNGAVMLEMINCSCWLTCWLTR